MPSVFHDIPQDAEMVAAVREFCYQNGLLAACGERVCRRARRCHGRWMADPAVAPLRVPPCLMARLDRLHNAIEEAKAQLHDLELDMAEIRGLPEPERAEDDPFAFGLWEE